MHDLRESRHHIGSSLIVAAHTSYKHLYRHHHRKPRVNIIPSPYAHQIRYEAFNAFADMHNVNEERVTMITQLSPNSAKLSFPIYAQREQTDEHLALATVYDDFRSIHYLCYVRKYFKPAALRAAIEYEYVFDSDAPHSRSSAHNTTAFTSC